MKLIIAMIMLTMVAVTAQAGIICEDPANDIVWKEYTNGVLTFDGILCDIIGQETLRGLFPLVLVRDGFDVFSTFGGALIAFYEPKQLYPSGMVMNVVELIHVK